MKKPTIISSLLDFLFPRYCAICGKRLREDEEAMCLSCNIDLPRTEHWKNPSDNLVAQLFWGKAKIERAISYFYFRSKDSNANIIYDIKYHNRPDMAMQMGMMIATEVEPDGFFNDIDCIVPLPISIKRKMKRGYNQCDMLARGISKATGIPVLPHVVIRTRFDGSQTKLTKMKRAENVDGVFELRDEEEIRGRHVLLVDDVITTGATTLSCACELLKVEGTRVSILSVAFAGKKEALEAE